MNANPTDYTNTVLFSVTPENDKERAMLADIFEKCQNGGMVQSFDPETGTINIVLKK